jgi:sigma-E factor negative regulatory protein RseA
MRESLSALLDDEANELEVERVLSAAGDDEELRATWRRYSLVRGALDGQVPGWSGLDVSAGVRDAIEAERFAGGAVSGLRQRLAKPFASLAVAASVAAMVVLGGQQLALTGQSEAGATEAYVARGPVLTFDNPQAMALPASYGTQPLPALEPATRTAYKELARQRMARYMQDHAEQAALNSPQGLIPFARVPQIRE